MTKSKTHHCIIEIDVNADSPRGAARLAWELLAGPGARRPVVKVRRGSKVSTVDLDAANPKAPKGARVFYRTVTSIAVLHEDAPDEISRLEIGSIEYAVTEGACVLAGRNDVVEKLDGRAMAKALTDAGSDPSFFRLDEDGRNVDED